MLSISKCVVATLVLGLASHTFAAIEYDSGGFEAPRFNAGPLSGQDEFTGGPLVFTPPGTVTADVVPGVGTGGTQGVRVERTGDANGFFSVVKDETPAGRYVQLHFDMSVTQSNQTFGPFFGVQVYGGAGAEADLIGSLGVDAANGEVLFQSSTFLTPSITASPVSFGVYNGFDILLDYQTQSYSVYVNDLLAGTSAFNSLQTNFFDAPIVATEASGDELSAMGVAYFDNYSIVPEPTAISAILGISLLAVRRRGR